MLPRSPRCYKRPVGKILRPLFLLASIAGCTLAWRPLLSIVSSPSLVPRHLLQSLQPAHGPAYALPRPSRLVSQASFSSQSSADDPIVDASDGVGRAVREEERMGPGAPEGYWSDVENIKHELDVFFTVRAAEERRLLEEKSGNPLRNYLGLADEEQKRIRRRGALIDRDLYSDLRRYGFDYLVLPIMEQGGFRAFAAIFAVNGDHPPREEQTGGLALGAALEAKLGTLSDKVSASVGKAGGEEGRKGQAPVAALGREVLRTGPESWRYETDGLDPAQWKKGELDTTASPAPKLKSDVWKYSGLSNPSKLYSALLLLDMAVAWGKATSGALDRGFLTPSLLSYIQLAAEVGILANLLSVPLTFLFVSKTGQPVEKAVSLALKAFVGGPVLLVECRFQGDFDVLETRDIANK
ncbi:hypothetical protein Naga_100077g17 [Nannochloropsis gaditana]|uniref:Uncharacterized protein n=1 Tax=Nannochloropsis gaditana TaxID=72520 RepID=W7TIS9_9STRA|nr:hypothetical protein Naga_100077g17 [Nannochloropsis gaditana]